MATVAFQSRKVLVLNKNYQPIKFASLSRVFKLLCGYLADGRPKARILDVSQDFTLFTWEDWAALRPEVEIPNRVLRALSNVSGIDYELMTDPSAESLSLSSDLGLASLEELTAKLGKVFGIKIGDEDASGWQTIGDVQSYIWANVEHSFIQTAKRKFMVPEIVLLTKHDKMPKVRSTFSRRAIYRRDKFTCQYCGCKPGSEELSIDHVIPKCKNGLTTWENVALACTKCNSRKGGRTPAEAGMKLLSVPSKPELGEFRGSFPLLDSWQSYIDEAYWSGEIINDN